MVTFESPCRSWKISVTFIQNIKSFQTIVKLFLKKMKTSFFIIYFFHLNKFLKTNYLKSFVDFRVTK